MTEITIQEIAEAAVEFIEAKLKAAELRQARADALTHEKCSGEASTDCYQTSWPQRAWCDRCRRTQAAHTEYRKVVARRTAALIRLKRVVARRNTQAAGAGSVG